MDNSIKELELNGWEVTAKDTGELDIEKDRLVFVGAANHVLKVAKKVNGYAWVELEGEIK